MSYSDLDNENVAAFKEFLSHYWKIIVFVFVVVIVAMFGWKYWQSHKAKHLENTSQEYTLLLNELNSEKGESVAALEQFNAKTKNIYGAFGSMVLARFYVDTKEYEKALAQLEQARTKTKIAALNDIISLRVARLQMHLNKLDDAMNSLSSIKNNAAQSEINDLRGDIFVMKKEYAKAKQAFELALFAPNAKDIQMQYLQMKLNYVEYLEASQPKDVKVDEKNADTEKVPALS